MKSRFYRRWRLTGSIISSLILIGLGLPLLVSCASSRKATSPSRDHSPTSPLDPAPTLTPTATLAPTPNDYSAPILTPAATPDPTFPADWPTAGWRTASPSAHGLDTVLVASIGPEVENNLPFIKSVLIIRNGYLVYEDYFRDYDETCLNDIRSATKSFTSALVGIALANGDLVNLDVTLASALPQYFEGNRHVDKRAITLRHLLMMRSGVEFNESREVGDYSGEVIEEFYSDPSMYLTYLKLDLVSYFLDFPMAHKPGEAWNYSTADAHLISGIFQHMTGSSLKEYAAEHLFAPLGITDFEWDEDAAGYSMGGAQLRLTSRDLAKFGYLYLNQGTWNGKQIVPTEWISLTTRPQGEAYYAPRNSVLPIEWYGYMWWTWNKPDWFMGYRVIQAEGYGGQMLYIYPQLDLVVVVTSNSFVYPSEEQGQRQAIYELVNKRIIPAVLDK